MVSLILAAVAFVGTHLLLSHPLRAPLVARLGGGRFAILYSVVALVTLGGLADGWHRVPPGEPLWEVGGGLWAVVSAVMLFASVLLVGSLIGNPALPGGPRAEAPRDVFTITRHPMMWAIALWGLCHIAIYPQPKNFVVAGAMIVLALGGSALQDVKKAAAQPDFWPVWERKTSWLPFAAIASGRARLGMLRPHTLAGGLVVWLAATWAHIPLAGWPAGIWRWVL